MSTTIFDKPSPDGNDLPHNRNLRVTRFFSGYKDRHNEPILKAQFNIGLNYAVLNKKEIKQLITALLEVLDYDS